MKYYFILNHPAHFHLFKYTILGLRKKRHQCYIYIRPKDVLEDLLITNGMQYEILSNAYSKRKLILSSSILGLAKKEFVLAKKIIRNRPDLLIGTDWAIAHLGRFFNIPSLVFNEDDTVATPENKYFYPFAHTIVLPECCDRGLWGTKRVSYKGYHELAYLDRKHFSFDHRVIKKCAMLTKPFIIIRLVKLAASHDRGKKGLGLRIMESIITQYSDKYDFLISTEEDRQDPYSKYIYSFNPIHMHHFLSAATLVIGDSQTMIAEAAVLGTPAIRFNDFIGKLSYLEELQTTYGLAYGIATNQPDKLLEQINVLLKIKNLKSEWQHRREKMLKEKINVTDFFIWLIENYPKSIQILQGDPTFELRFLEPKSC